MDILRVAASFLRRDSALRGIICEILCGSSAGAPKDRQLKVAAAVRIPLGQFEWPFLDR